MSNITGKCLCGAVRFKVDSVEHHYHACHCGMCRRWSGGPGFAVIATGIEFEGEENIGRYSSSSWAERGFCRQCGSGLFYRLTSENRYFMNVGCFDDSSIFNLTAEIYIDNKPDGYDFAGDHPRLTEAEVIAQSSPPSDN